MIVAVNLDVHYHFAGLLEFANAAQRYLVAEAGDELIVLRQRVQISA